MSAEPKWTKGPWKAFFTPDGKKVLGVGDAEGGGIASLWLDGKEQAANAHLIASAPDLYSALAGLLAAYSEPDQQICCNGHECGCRGASVRDQAEYYAAAALAKARGESQ